MITHAAFPKTLLYCFIGPPRKGALLKHAAYIGVIGSREKIAVMFDMMLKEGYSKEQLNDIYTPIGLDIGSETPMEIALAIMAEILCVKNNATGKSLKDL